MKTTCLIIALGLMIITFGCSTISVHYDYDTKADFTNLKSYSWTPGTIQKNISSLVVKRIHDSVRTQLESRGYTFTTDNPDFLIAMHVTKQQKKLVVSDYDYNYRSYSGAQGSYWRSGVTREFEYEEGTLILDFIDTQSKELSWRGVATAEVLHYTNPEKREKRINNAVQKILNNFPPTEKY